jgi:hypothetical protein
LPDHSGFLYQLPAIQFAPTASKLVCGLLGGNISLWLGQHLISNLKLPHRCTAQQWREKVDVEVA